MKDERFRQIRDLFDAAMEQPPDSRQAFLEEACRDDKELLTEVVRLLAAQGEPTTWLDGDGPSSPAARLKGRRIGAYEILRQLGEGGMGTVYLASRADGVFEKQVALKIVQSQIPGQDILDRFQREREILAKLDHPNIARIMDGGTTEEGLPYLVMEYVEGQPIDVYCDQHKLNVEGRLKLFRDVCGAVDYAHQQRVIHRDIKPGNVLVSTDGTVKLLDFGIAKLSATDPDGTMTETDLMAMTPEYASPEQVNGETITPMTDVYALGILLYELLTGERPYRFKSRIFREIARVICEEPPTRPSVAVTTRRNKGATTTKLPGVSRIRAGTPEELKRRLQGDLDSVLMKALDKEPLERYRSADDFSEDLRSHLEHLPVSARRAWLASLGSLAHRSRWWIFGAVALGMAVQAEIIRLPRVLHIIGPMLLILGGLLWVQWGRSSAHMRRMLMGSLQVVAAYMILVLVGGQLAPEFTGRVFEIGMVGLAVWHIVVHWFRPRPQRRLGVLLLDLSVRTRFVILCRVFTTAGLIWALTNLYGHFFGDEPIHIVRIVMLYALFILGRNVGQFEIRERGLAVQGVSMIPWTRVRSYSWDPSPGETEVLWVDYLGGMFTVRLHVRPEDRPKVGAIFEQQLFEWPE